MQLRNKIFSYCLLAIYLLVVGHESISHSHTNSPDEGSLSHEHENFKNTQHNNHFHVGIFHFLGHLFQNINHADDLAGDHIVVSQKSSNKKANNHDSSVIPNINEQRLPVSEVDAESLPDPPYHLSLLQRFKLPNSPLRAPPGSV